MKKLVLLLIILLVASQAYGYQSLREVYDNAEPGDGYLKYIVLDPELEYAGDLITSYRDTVRIIGNGAIIHAVSSNAISANRTMLDVSGCVFVDGISAITYQSGSSGKIFNNTIVGFSESGIKIDHPNLNVNVEVFNNIITNCQYGIWAIEEYLPEYIAYNVIHSISGFEYAQLCPS
ncbi:MAG: hypothetical protein GY855_06450 [candidate division Zixibacteria bacterium]|nr:hypothetical protein [candidate division Zixibacteria bacterium]